MIDANTLTRLQAALRRTEKESKDPNGHRTNLRKLQDYARGEQFGSRMQYWRGREPINTDKWESIRKLATSDDQIGPALDRVISGILGRDPEWTLRAGENPVTSALLDDEAAEASGEDLALALWLQELEQAGTVWHKDAELFKALREALRAALWAGQSSLRVYIPSEYADEAMAGSQPSLADALELIHVQAVTALEGGPVTDGHGRTVAHWYAYTATEADRKVPHVELHTPQWIQHYRVEGLNLVEVGDPVENPLFDERKRRRPNYLMHTLTREGGTAITSSIIDAQDGLNIEKTNMRRNSDMAGFRSIVTFNAESPVDEDGNPAQWTIGPDVVVELRGVSTGVDAQTGEGDGIATPSAMVIDPVDPSVFLKATDSWKAQILEAFDQAHILAKFNAVSGESKRESRDDFDKRLIKESEMVARALAWVIPTALRFAAFLTSDTEAEALKDLTADPRLYLDVSRGNLNTFRELAGVYALGLVSRETVVEANPAVTDAQAELKRLDAEAETKAKAQAPPRRQEGES